MGKVGTERLFHKNSGKQIFVDVRFYTKGKYFKVCDIPKDIEDWYGSKLTSEDGNDSIYTGEITAESYDKAVSIAKKVYDDYYDQDITEVKLIAYKLGHNHPPKKGEYTSRRDFHFGHEYTLGIEYKILYRVIIGDENFISEGTYEQCKVPKMGSRSGGYKLHREDSNSFGYGDFTKLPYDENLHDFFKNVEGSISSLILKVSQFFGEDSNHLLENIKNSGSNLLTN